MVSRLCILPLSLFLATNIIGAAGKYRLFMQTARKSSWIYYGIPDSRLVPLRKRYFWSVRFIHGARHSSVNVSRLRYPPSIHQHQTGCCPNEHLLSYLLPVSRGLVLLLINTLTVAWRTDGILSLFVLTSLRAYSFYICLMFLFRHAECSSLAFLPLWLLMVRSHAQQHNSDYT